MILKKLITIFSVQNSKFLRDKKQAFAIILIFLGIASRTFFHIGDNVEFITSGALLSSAYLGFGWSMIVPLVVLAITDLLIGNTNIFIFTWSAYLAISYIGNLSNLSNLRGGSKISYATGLGVIASLWFYIWTNFGVWLLDSWGMYPKTIEGLTSAYIMGLPFLKWNLIGNLFFVPLSFTLVEVAIPMRNEIANGITIRTLHLLKNFRKLSYDRYRSLKFKAGALWASS